MLGTDSNSYDVFQSTVHGLPFAACVKDVILAVRSDVVCTSVF